VLDSLIVDVDHQIVGAVAEGNRAAERLLQWSRFPYLATSPATSAQYGWLDDLRYSDGVSRSWAAVRVELPPP
jgi:hypothetical protein